MSKLNNLQTQFQAKVVEQEEVQNQLAILKNSLWTTKNKFTLFKLAKESEIRKCMSSVPEKWVQSESWPHVQMHQCPHKDFWEAKERKERRLREELESHEKTHNDALTLPLANIRTLEEKEISLTSDLTMIQAQINCCPKLKLKKNKK
jgi:hypothetical protein